uniref:ADF-H domain-containing protein n=1 Tax=Percolomonas cosmopolitus TaxID=63605 RepID=A0A7S1KLH7_9EUKA
MSIAGIKVTKQALEDYDAVKRGKQYRFLVLNLTDDDKFVDTMEKADREASYEDMLQLLPEKEARFVVFDLEYTFEDSGVEREASKLLLIFWCPNGTKVRQKMMFASTLKELQSQFQGISKTIQATDASEVDRTGIIADLQK